MSLDTTENKLEIFERIPESRILEAGDEFVEPENEGINRSSINSRAAAKAFHEKPSVEIFSGIFHGQIEFETLGRHAGEEVKETPLQKYQRLRNEVQQLSLELEQEKKEKVEGVSSKDLLQQVNLLQKQLSEISEKKIDNQDQLGVPSKLISQLKAATGPRDAGEPSRTENSSDGSQVTYELFYRPDFSAEAGSGKVSDLDSRLARLEALVGTSSSQVEEGNLVGWLKILEEKLKLLTPTHIAAISNSLKPVLTDLSKAADLKKAQPQTPESEAKVTELFEKVEKWDEHLHTLPHLIERLKTLRQLHQDATQFSETLKTISQEQTAVTDSLKSQEKLLKTVEGNFAQNSAAIQSNIDHLDKRITDLLQKVSQLK